MKILYRLIIEFIQILLLMSSNERKIFFYSWSKIAFNFNHFLVPFDVDWFLSLSFFHDLDIFQKGMPFPCRMSLSVDLFDVPS